MSGRWTLFHTRLGRRLKPRARCYLAMAGRVTGSATISNEGGPRAPVASARVQDDSGALEGDSAAGEGVKLAAGERAGGLGIGDDLGAGTRESVAEQGVEVAGCRAG